MEKQSIVNIQIFNNQSELIDRPKIWLTLAGSNEKLSVSKFTFDKNTLLWVSEPVGFGKYQLTISAKDYSEEQMIIDVETKERFLTIALHKAGLPFIFQGGKRMYFEKEDNKIGFLLGENIDHRQLQKIKEEDKNKKSSRLQRSLSLTQISKRKINALGQSNSSTISLDLTGIKSKKTLEKIKQDLTNAPEIIAFGEIIKIDNSPPLILTTNFEVITEPTVSWESLENALRTENLEIYYQSKRVSTIYHVRSTSSQELDYGALAERVCQIPGVRQCNSIVITQEENTAINAGDVVSPIQFYQFITRLPEAWEQVENNPAKIQESFGSADVVVAVHDGGIQTSSAAFTVQHDEFKGNVTGGAIGTLPGMSMAKVLYTFDFRVSPMSKGNNAATTHGSWVSGTILAKRDGTNGVVGGAANCRLLSFLWSTTGAGAQWADFFEYMSGIDPQWQQNINHAAAEVFPEQINSGKNPIPHNNIINCSHTHSGSLVADMSATLQSTSLFGRSHKGTLIFVAAGNNDEDTRGTSKWGENYNVMKVAGSSLDVLGEEVRMNYSNFVLIADKTIDFSAPSESQNFNPTIHEPPQMYGFTTTDLNNTAGAVRMGKGTVANIVNSPNAGTTDVQVSVADYAGFATGNQVIISDNNNLIFSEWHQITKVAPNILRTNRTLGFSFTAANAKITQLTGNTGLSNVFGGTSAAVPQASAIAALILSVKPQLSWLEVRQIMRETAVAVNLRYRGTNYAVPANTNRYRWLDSANNNLIDANGLLDITGGNKTIAKGGLANLIKGTRILTLNNIAGLNPKQALLIGAETRLNSAHPRANINEIDVVRADELEIGDTLFVGRNSHSVIANTAAVIDTTIWIQSLDGFLPNDLVSIETPTNLETVQLVAAERVTALIVPGVFGPSDTGFTISRIDRSGGAIAGGLRNAFPRKAIVRIARSVATTMNPAIAAAVAITVASVNDFAVGHDITIQRGATNETVRITAIDTALLQFTITRLNAAGAPIVGGLTNAYAAGVTISVRTAHAQFEGPFIVQGKVGNVITLDKPILVSGLDSRRVYKKDTELRVIIRVKGMDPDDPESFALGANQIEIDPLKNDHSFNINAVEHIRVGRVADYSLGFGYGRLDALEAVKAAKNFHHKDCDLMLRNYWESDTAFDDGETNIADKEVESPDIWVINGAKLPVANHPVYKENAPHQHPQISIDPPVFIGAGNNDMEVAGTKVTAGDATYTIEIDGTPGGAAADTFKWQKDGGAFTIGVAITLAEIPVGPVADGVKIKFAVINGHNLGDKWIVQARKIEKRFIYIRSYNRGNKAFFKKSTLGATQLNVAESRVLLCLSDGTPSCRFSSTANVPGNNDMEVTGIYTGANAKALYTVEISATAAGGDTITWWRDGVAQPAVALTAATLIKVLNDGVIVKFGSHTGHSIGDRWDINARSGAANEPFLNLDHFWEKNEVFPFALNSENAGSRVMSPSFSISELAATTQQIDEVDWPEADRFPTNSPNKPKPANKLRLFALGEVVPHDGLLNGYVAKQNNNISYRELVFAQFRFTKNNGLDELGSFLEVDGLGTPTVKNFKINIRTTAGFFETEKTSIFITREKADNTIVSTRYFYDTTTATWKFAAPDPAAWLVFNQPLEARRPDGTQPNATGEQYDITFNGTLTVDNTFVRITFEARIGSSFRDLVISKQKRILPIYAQSQLPTNRYKSKASTDLIPKSHFFAVPSTLVQAQERAFGPLIADAENKFSLTSLFRSPTDVKAYAVSTGSVLIQRNATNANLVNLFLKPLFQPMNGMTPVKYFVYRGLTLTHFLKGISATDEIEVRDDAGSSEFIHDVWIRFLAQNTGAVTMPAKVIGWDPTAAGTTLIDSSFFKEDPNLQLPFVIQGMYLGDFYADSGNQDFGFEIILEEGEFQPDLNYARKTSHEVTVAGMATGTVAEKFLVKLEREKILNYIDPAAFFGLHLSDGGVLKVNDGSGTVTTPSPVDIYTNILSKFFTKNTLYVDIRNEQSNSLNFSGKYDDTTVTHNALEVGSSAGTIVLSPYATSKWPILIFNSTGVTNANDFNEVHLRLRLDYNHKPAMYVEHGKLLVATSNPRFIKERELFAAGLGVTKTNVLGFRFPNHDAGAGKKDNVPWLIKLQYCLRIHTTNTPFPNTVLSQTLLTDNLFGPVDINPIWSTGHTLKWWAMQDKKFVDGTTALFSYVAQRGVAFEGAGAAERVIFFAAAKDNLENPGGSFTMNKGLTGGTSSKADFFSESKNLNGYNLVYDQATEAGAKFTTLYFSTDPDAPQPVSSMLVAGFTKAQFDSLKAVAGLSVKYPRNIALTEELGSPFTVDGKTYRKFKAGLRGLKDDGTAGTFFPGTVMFVYSVDGFFYFTKEFSVAQALPTVYSRNYEEAIGALTKQPRHYSIKTAVLGTKCFIIEGIDLRRVIRPGDLITVKDASTNSGNYHVVSVSVSGSDSNVFVTEAIPNNIHALGDLYEPSRTFEDYFIGLDQDGVIGGTNPMGDIVSAFIAAVTAVPDNAGTKAALLSLINTTAPKILERGRQFVRNNTLAYADDRPLYWARLKMIVAIKSHHAMLKSISDRDELVLSFEKLSRGLNNAGFGAAGTSKKLLISGFDPFMLNPFDANHNVLQSNPSGAVALALHGQTITTGLGVNILIQAGLFPVRYRDFDQLNGLGVVEDFFVPFIGHDAASANMIITMSQGGTFRFDVDRHASRFRGGYMDNENRPSPPNNPQFLFPVAQAGKEFYLTTLPVAKLTSAATGRGFDIGENKEFTYFFMSGTTRNDVDQTTVGALAPDLLTASTTPKLDDIKSVSGSGGDYLSNEIFYRVARERTIIEPGLETGHYHIPKIQAPAAGINSGDRVTVDFDAVNMKALIEEVIESIKRAFA